MTSEIIKIIKDKEHYRTSVEIKESAKGDTAISIKVRSDGSTKDAIDEAIQEYKRAKEQLAK